jgi:hypothetical protein
VMSLSATGVRGRSKITIRGYSLLEQENLFLRTVELLVREVTSPNTGVRQRLRAVAQLLRIAGMPVGEKTNDAHIVEAAANLTRALPFLEQIANSQRYSQGTRSRAEALAVAIRGKQPAG